MNTENKNTQSEENEAAQANAAKQLEDQLKVDGISSLEEDIIRNDAIPETSKDTPGSNGAYPVGAFDTSKE